MERRVVVVGGVTATEVRAMASAASREAGDMEAREADVEAKEAAAVIEQLRPQAVEAEAGAVVEAVVEAAAEAAGEVARMAAAASRATEMEAREALGAVTATRAIRAVYRAAAARSSWHRNKRRPDRRPPGRPSGILNLTVADQIGVITINDTEYQYPLGPF